ncbi:MAG: ATP-binding cassette, subfamily multidrug efflux pump, partial [Nocardioidaceae bacterium]|nr:ATP-binding cassette, subfamily multidrug efflux pump [Nocardioidaceae bacterium]
MSGRGPLAMQGPPAKPEDFRSSARRLLSYLQPQAPLVWAVGALAVVAVGLSVVGPKLLGHATDIIFTGFIGGRLPPGVSQAEAVANLRRQGNDKAAAVVQALHLHPGQGIDYSA